MTSPAFLARLEDIIDTSGAAPRIEAMLPGSAAASYGPHLTAGPDAHPG